MARFRQVEPDDADLRMVETVLEIAHVQSKGRDVRIGLLGLDEHNNICYLQGGYDYDDGRPNDDVPTSLYCGVSKEFLAKKMAARHPVRRQKKPDTTVLSTTTYSEETHKKLLEEEEKSKERAEKKRLRKLKQRERRRLEKSDKLKLKTEHLLEDNNDVTQCKAVEGKGVLKKSKEATATEAQETPAASSNPDASSKPAAASKPAASSNSNNSGSSSEEDSSEDEDKESLSGQCEQELDLSSCFISKAVDIAKRKLELKPKPENKPEKKIPAPVIQPKTKPNEESNEVKQNSPEDLQKMSTELAVMGNKFASNGRFDVAVKYFTDAIKYNPKEYRLFGNRSFCFEKMQEYERAVTDAELSLNLCPGWVKGLYRKGRALAGLQRYDEAAQAFKEVLQLDSSCLDAAQELMRVQIMQLMEFGYSREQSSNALIIHGTVKKALEALSKISGASLTTNGVYPNDAASPPSWFQAPTPTNPQIQPPTKAQTQQLNGAVKPRQEVAQSKLELFPVWVGNLSQSVTESMVKNLFSIAGDVHSVKQLHSRRCAFVNFTCKRHCDIAIQKLHGHDLHGSRVTVRYPDRIPIHMGMSKAARQAVDLPENCHSSSKECFFWRTMGCSRRPVCPYKHILENKGIDRRKSSTTEEESGGRH